MIFVTVGTDLPFDRLVGTIDRWAAAAGRRDVFAQIGATAALPRHIDYAAFLDPREYRRLFTEAQLVIGHAGMGTILTALQYRKPLLVMPRLAALGEQRNDHQLATARRLSALGRVEVALDEEALVLRLGCLEVLQASEHEVSASAGADLLASIQDFISTHTGPGAAEIAARRRGSEERRRLTSPAEPRR